MHLHFNVSSRPRGQHTPFWTGKETDLRHQGARVSRGNSTNTELTLVLPSFPPGSFEQVHGSPKNSHPGGHAMWKMKHMNLILPRDILFVWPWKARICLRSPFLAEISIHFCFKLDSGQFCLAAGRSSFVFKLMWDLVSQQDLFSQVLHSVSQIMQLLAGPSSYSADLKQRQVKSHLCRRYNTN